MSVETAVHHMTSDRKDVPYQIRCTRDWIDRVEYAANRLGLSSAAFIRMVVTQRLDADGIPETPPPPKKKPKPSK